MRSYLAYLVVINNKIYVGVGNSANIFIITFTKLTQSVMKNMENKNIIRIMNLVKYLNEHEYIYSTNKLKEVLKVKNVFQSKKLYDLIKDITNIKKIRLNH
jgi:hypothetical protein